MAIDAVLSVLVLGGSVLNGSRSTARCSSARLHPHIGALNSAFEESHGYVSQINNASNGLTQQSAARLAAEHRRLIGVLQGIQLSNSDTNAVDTYAASLTTYDQQIAAALQMSDVQSANAAVHTANAGLDAASQQLNLSLRYVPDSCTT